jgi:hypothetical protein
MVTGIIGSFVIGDAQGGVRATGGVPAQGSVLTPGTYRHYIDSLNAGDRELYPQYIRNDDSWEFLSKNIPLLDCPDKQLEQTYYFRWWTFRKHIRKTPGGFVILEFLPDVSWAGKYNTINCAAALHVYEGRWLHDQQYIDDYVKFWYRGGGDRKAYSSWMADAIWNQALVTGDYRLATDLEGDLISDYGDWEKTNLDSNGLYWQTPDRDGMECSICGGPDEGRSGYRATINAYQYADAMAIARIAHLEGRKEVSERFVEKAGLLKNNMEEKLWDDTAGFFKVLGKGGAAGLCSARELHGYTPWYFDMPSPQFSVAWKYLMDPHYFYAPFGPTTAEQDHPGFSISYAGHECQWNGPSWPLATSITLTALANLLNDYSQTYITRADYFKLLLIYSRSQRLQRADGKTVPWIDEDLNPYTGDWISRTRLSTWENGHWSADKGGEERGKDYNHSTFCDLVITGLIGLRPAQGDGLVINPLVPAGAWDYFCLDNLLYHGRILTILYDRTGGRYHRGKGLQVWADGKRLGGAPTLRKLELVLTGAEPSARPGENGSRLPENGPLILESDSMRVELAADRPLIRSYTNKRSGTVFEGDAASTGWIVNGRLYPWSEWTISRHQDGAVSGGGHSCIYRLSLSALDLSFDYSIGLTDLGLHIGISHISDPGQHLISLSWGERALFNAGGDSLRWFALQSSIMQPFEKEKIKNRGLWSYDENRGKVTDAVPSESTLDACLWAPGKVVAGIMSNVTVFPVRLSNGPGKSISLGLNTWIHRLEGQPMPDLSADLLFGGDINGDGEITDHDYFRWRNLHLADVPDWIRRSISYKVFMDAPTLKEPNTTLEELDKIVGAIYHVTDGLPQIVYLVGWQFRGHDTGYPSFDEWNERLGPHEGIYRRGADYPDRFNACLSYHINIDDAYRGNKGFDPAILATDFDGRPMFWEGFHSDSAFHLSHFKDVRSGLIFSRLDGLLQTIPVKGIIHIDAMRSINCNPAWEKDSVGVAAELELGLKPITRWLRERGIESTTEGQNGNPHELAGLVAGVYHLDDPTEAGLMVHHRKLVGGGFNDGRGRFEDGIGTDLQEDVAYKDLDNSLCFTKDWNKLKERIFLGSLLYIYYQQRQLVDVKKSPGSWVLRFDDGTITRIDSTHDHLLVTCGDIVIARDDDRFIPMDSSIYVFSKDGGPKQWLLPPAFRGKPLEVFSLTEKGSAAAPGWKITGDTITLPMAADVPEKILIEKQ